MNRLRHLPLPRLLAAIALLLSGLAATAAAAVALTGSASPPPRKPLANAIHDALHAPKLQGVNARVTFTNRLLDASMLSGQDPLLTGATGRLWIAEGGQVRLELQSRRGDTQLVSDGRRFWLYDASSHSLYKGELPAGSGDRDQGKRPPSLPDVQDRLRRLGALAQLSRAIPGTLAGRSAYTVRAAPRGDGGLVAGAALAWDAGNGVPLRLAVYARGVSQPVLELLASQVSFGPIPASTFRIAPPRTATVTDLGGRPDHEHGTHPGHGQAVSLGRMRRSLTFPLAAPDALAGRPRREAHLLGTGKEAGAALRYGDGLGAVWVVERLAQRNDRAPSASGDDGRGSPRLSLPQVSVGGAKGTVLATPLGTFVRFDRAGVTYTVVGSAPRSVVEGAARGLG
jgi:outer membrane lipoprotein-sorting protein